MSANFLWCTLQIDYDVTDLYAEGRIRVWSQLMQRPSRMGVAWWPKYLMFIMQRCTLEIDYDATNIIAEGWKI